MRRFPAIALALILFARAAPAGAGHIDEKIKHQQAKIHAVHEKLQRKRAQLEGARARVGDLQAQLAQTNRNIGAVRSRLGVLEHRMHSTQRKLSWTRIQLTAAHRTLQRHTDALNRRLVDAYEHGDLGYLDVLLAARSFADFVERWNDVRYVVRTNEATIRGRRADETRVHGIEVALLGTQAVLQNEQSQADQQQRALSALADERNNLLQAADQERRAVQQEVEQLDEVSAEEQAQLAALIRQRQAEEEARREAERRARQLAGENVPPAAGAPGSVMWPVSGPITSPYGMRTNPVTGRFRLHSGIDIGAAGGTTIEAAAEGRVIIAGWDDGGYGNMVVIDHGGQMSTLYGHMSQIYVGVGQDVQRGQAIGAVGSTGRSTGPHLHFEIRMNGNAVDPMTYLR